jgi:predicted Zn-dependent peptidase
MNRLGRTELNYGRHRPISRTLRELSAVTVDEVNAVARQLLRQPYGVAVLGPYRSKGALPRRLRLMAG